MTDQLISFETAKLAREKGFKEYTNDLENISPFYYTTKKSGYKEGQLNHVHVGIPAPTQSLLQKWLRDEYKIHILVYWKFTQEEWIYRYNISDPTYRIGKKSFDGIESSNFYDTYEEALEQGLQEALKLI